MAKFNLQTRQISDTNRIDLDALLSDTKIDDISATKISDTKQENISATKISATKISATNYMNNYKREKYDTIRIDFHKGTKDMLKTEAAKKGISITKLIKLALAEYLKEK